MKNQVEIFRVGPVLPDHSTSVQTWAADVGKDIIPQDKNKNLAFERPYTMEPNPNYELTSDPGDKYQLTDGIYSTGILWRQKNAVGWYRVNPVSITIDLGGDRRFCRISVSTAAGRYNVEWPHAIAVYIRKEQSKWQFIGDMLEDYLKLNGGFPHGYAIRKIHSNNIAGYGRYVKLIVDQYPYTFIDEIELVGGHCKEIPPPQYAEISNDPLADYHERRVRKAMVKRMINDLNTGLIKIQQETRIDSKLRAQLISRWEVLRSKVETQKEKLTLDAGTIIPLTKIHEEIFALNAAVHRANGCRGLITWVPNQWDYLSPSESPKNCTNSNASLSMRLLQGEKRIAGLNLTNVEDHVVTAQISVAGLSNKSDVPKITLFQVLFTDTSESVIIASALKKADPNNKLSLSVPPGMTIQVWIEVNAEAMNAGEFEALIFLESAEFLQTVPLVAHVLPFTFSKLQSVHVGGWDYSQGRGARDLTPENIPDMLRELNRHRVDTPWGTNAVQPRLIKYELDGEILDISFDEWDEWVKRWPSANQYAVFLNVRDTFYGEKIGTSRFNQMVANWVNAWANHIEKQGLRPDQLLLMLIDEPRTDIDAKIIEGWAKAIKLGCRHIKIIENPFFDLDRIDLGVFAHIDVLLLHLSNFILSKEEYRLYYNRLRRSGKEIWFYSTSGPAKLMDPINYYRGQFWWAFKYGATGSFYWSFSDEGGRSSWSAYAGRSIQFSPLFISADSVIPSKHMAAIREGVQDYECLMLLQRRLIQLDDFGVKSNTLEAARKIFQESIESVLTVLRGSSERWDRPSDRGVMDRARERVLSALLSLKDL